jgi:uncharacterized protein DUF4349
MKHRMKKGLFYVAVGFVAMFGARLVYGYLSPPEQTALSDETLGRAAISDALILTEGGRSFKGNYASEKLKVQRAELAEPLSVDQKYEKVASVVSKTNAFDEDEKNVRELTKKHNALIQFEQSTGLSGSRRVELTIGVPPDRFDPMVAELHRIGELSSIRIDKTDKTNEYKELKAKRASLEKTRDALNSLKSKGGRIEEFTNLENRILEIDEQIQETGVKLGDYDQENEFCTVKLSLVEKGAAPPGISFRHRLVVALAWTIRYYAILLALLFFGAALTLLVVVILQRLNVIPPPPATRQAAEAT